MEVIRGETKHVEDCVEAVLASQLGAKYFGSSYDRVKRQLNEGISKGEVYVALDNAGGCLGFAWCIPQGAFHAYPYIHILAVKKNFRGMGIGKQLISYCENVVYKDSSKIFMVVAEFNTRAQGLYEQMGYVEVAKLPGLYIEGVVEHLMMKRKPKDSRLVDGT